MKLMIPYPHLAYECLELFNCKISINANITKNLHQEIKFAVQINGKTRI